MLVENIEIEDINPIPPIEDKDQKEVFAFYGLASYTGQCLDKGMVNFAMAYRLLDESALTEQEWSDIYDHLNKQTFGRLLNQIKSKIEIPIKIEERLNLSLKKRNWLAHDFFYDYATHFYDPFSFWKVSLKERKEKHFVLDSVNELGRYQFLEYMNNSAVSNKLAIFIHGYNVSFKDALLSAAQLKVDVLQDTSLMLYSWPSKGKLFAYDYDRENATHSAKFLAELLETISALRFEEVVIIAHSMGTFCLSESLQSKPFKSEVKTRALLAASDVAVRSFIDLYSERFKSNFDQVAIYALSKDLALRFSKFKSLHSRVGDARPICVVEGIETIDVSQADHQFWGLRHSYHSKHEKIIDDLYQFIMQGVPAEYRNLMKMRDKENLECWSLQSN